MTGKAFIPADAAWAVTVTTPALGGGEPLKEVFYSAFRDPERAIQAVRAYQGVSVDPAVLVEAKSQLSDAEVAYLSDNHSLSAGNVIRWVALK